MKIKLTLIVLVISFVSYCGILVSKTCLFKDSCTDGRQNIILLQNTAEVKTPAFTARQEPNQPPVAEVNLPAYGADHGPKQTLIIGAADPNTEDPKKGYKFQVKLNTQAAAIESVTFSDGDADGNGKGDGFDDANYKNPKPLQLLFPAKSYTGPAMSLANNDFIIDQRVSLKLNQLNWQVAQVHNEPNSQIAVFDAIIKDKNTGEPVFKLTKTYQIVPASFDVNCSVTIENMSNAEHKASFKMQGPVGIKQEGLRSDIRKAITAYLDIEKNSVDSQQLDTSKLEKAKTLEDRRMMPISGKFLWSSVTNKYFGAIIVPQPMQGAKNADWVADNIATFYNYDGKSGNEDDTIGVELKVTSNTFEPAGSENDKLTYNFNLYFGPKDKRLFDKNPVYDKLGFVRTITFMGCFCFPAAIMNGLSFGILSAMDWMYGYIHNYGIAIIILVFLIRLAMHPITKKSQVSMSKMSKLGPQIEELKKKYANNKAELQKQTMQLYKKQGASPVMGFLPMLIQMPIWISLYGAIQASVSLRGAPFLPFWITDLSAPDALFRFQAFTLPLFGQISSFNLLPILMGVAMYLQQKTMPQTPSTNSQAAQQQKMMMIMMPLMFPLFLYTAPSGLNLYIMASTFAGVIEQSVIRKHIKEKDELEAQGMVSATSKTGGKVKKKKSKPFFRTNK